MKKLYKVLDPELTSPFQRFPFKLNEWFICENFNEDQKKDCASGFYATELEGITYSYRPGRVVCECEVDGRSVEIDPYKRRYEKIRPIKVISTEDLKQRVKNEWHGDYDLYHALFPVNPLENQPKKVTDEDIELLKQWASVCSSVRESVLFSVCSSVRGSVRSSVWDSVCASVGASVWNSVCDSVLFSVCSSVRYSVWNSVRASVWDSVRYSVWHFVSCSIYDSMYAYISSLFLNIENWKGIEHEKGENPFQPAITLWMKGLVPSLDGETWRLHSGEEAKVVWEGSL